MTRGDKNKLMTAVRYSLPQKYMTKLKAESADRNIPMADIVLNMIGHTGNYKQLKLKVIENNGKMHSFVANKVVEYYRNAAVE